MQADLENLTLWLNRLGTGDAPAEAADASEQLFVVLYDELRRIARAHMRKEASDHTLSATALAHEAYFRLADQQAARWKNRAHFLAVASTMMRRILVNHALAHRAAKRDAQLVGLTLAEVDQVGLDAQRDLIAVHDALLAFEALDPRAAKVVELRFFGGMEIEEIAQALELSPATVKRDWALARAWLHRELGSADPHAAGCDTA
jgi:RNA polymerase sigma factor (TIGR02999 family)